METLQGARTDIRIWACSNSEAMSLADKRYADVGLKSYYAETGG